MFLNFYFKSVCSKISPKQLKANEKKNQIVKGLFFLACFTITGVCYSQQNNDFFSNFPAKTVFKILDPVSTFTPIICEMPIGTNDTIWAENLVQPPMWKIQAGMDDESVFVISQNKGSKKAFINRPKRSGGFFYPKTRHFYCFFCELRKTIVFDILKSETRKR